MTELTPEQLAVLSEVERVMAAHQWSGMPPAEALRWAESAVDKLLDALADERIMRARLAYYVTREAEAFIDRAGLNVGPDAGAVTVDYIVCGQYASDMQGLDEAIAERVAYLAANPPRRIDAPIVGRMVRPPLEIGGDD